MSGTSGRLRGKRILITGTSPNIGGTMARGFAAHGARVACTDLVPDLAESCAKRIRDEGGEAIALSGDVTDEGHADDAVATVLRTWGGIDVLVNNAVWIHHRGLLDMTIEDYRRQVNVVLGGAFLFTRAASRAMIKAGRGGSVINILSTAALQGQPGNIGYSTAKAGLLNFTRSVAMELAEYGIRVNGFTPTATQTTDPDARLMQADRRPPAYSNDFTGLFPMPRLPTPDDYVPSLVLLASDESLMMTGTNLVVDGGASAKYWPWVPRPAA